MRGLVTISAFQTSALQTNPEGNGKIGPNHSKWYGKSQNKLRFLTIFA
jgi:hypothetical protein